MAMMHAAENSNNFILPIPLYVAGSMAQSDDNEHSGSLRVRNRAIGAPANQFQVLSIKMRPF
jgi:hypothetical protein